MRGYLDARDDVDLLRWTGDDGTYNVVVRADGLPLAWRIGDGKLRTPGAAQGRRSTQATLIRIERTDRGGTGTAARRATRCGRVVVMPLDTAARHAARCADSLVSSRSRACGDDNRVMSASRSPTAIRTVIADPLGASAERGARRAHPRRSDLPAVPSGLVTWKDGDFVLANDKVALVIEDVGDSDLYDPWGGRPVGLARVEGGELVEPNNFGELFLLTGRSTVVTESVTRDRRRQRRRAGDHPRARQAASAAVLREPDRASSISDQYTDIEAAIDYELAPGAEHVDVRMRYASARAEPTMRAVDAARAHVHERTRRCVPARRRLRRDAQRRAVHRARRRSARRAGRYIPGEGTLGSSLVGERAFSARSRRASRSRRAARPSACTRSS